MKITNAPLEIFIHSIRQNDKSDSFSFDPAFSGKFISVSGWAQTWGMCDTSPRALMNFEPKSLWKTYAPFSANQKAASRL